MDVTDTRVCRTIDVELAQLNGRFYFQCNRIQNTYRMYSKLRRIKNLKFRIEDEERQRRRED